MISRIRLSWSLLLSLWLLLALQQQQHSVASAFTPTPVRRQQQRQTNAAAAAAAAASLQQSSIKVATTTTTTCSSTCTRLYMSSSSSDNSGSSSEGGGASIDRLSNECVAAIQLAHDIGHEIGLTELLPEALWAGVVARPERAGTTLQRFQIWQDEARFSAIKTLKSKQQAGLNTNTNPTKQQQQQKEAALPFSNSSKALLNRACQIADRMESTVVRSEHLLLALAGYNDGNKIQSSPIVEVLGNMKSISKGFSVFEFCQELVHALPNTPLDNNDNNTTIVQQETVVIGRSTPANTNTLKEVGVDMTQLALDGKLDPVFGRDAEIRMALRTLGRRRKNNPCLIGEPGVGKSAVAEAIAQVLANGIRELEELEKKAQQLPAAAAAAKVLNPIMNQNNPSTSTRKEKDKNNKNEPDDTQDVDYKQLLPRCPTSLLGYRLINIDLASLVAGTSNRGDFEKKVKSLIEEASNNNVILFIDEVHLLLGLGGSSDGGAMNAANLLKPALARGELRVLGATTTPEYRKYIEKDGALERRFQPLEVKEPTWDETVEILSAIMPKYEEYHGVEYTSNALVAAAKLSDRYISDRMLPDKAIDLLDTCGSMIKMAEEGETFFVTEDAVSQVISEMTGIPIGKLDTGEKTRLTNLEQELEERIKGQQIAVRAVAKSIRRARSGMRDGKRPVASLLFCGPTGVGKTELCKALAETYYGQEKDMIRIDMSEYMDKFSTSRLIGAPPGYVGYDEGGQLTEAVRRSPHSVVLFDELEKAHEDVLNILLQIMDEGVLTDGKGRKVNFKNTIFVMTSNIGSKDILKAAKQEGRDVVDEFQITSDVVKAALEEAMKPELLNRIDEIVVFSPLSYDNLKDIATNLIADTVKRTADDQNISMTVSDNVPEMITRETMKVASLYGARPTRRAVQRYVEDTMAEAIMSGFINEGDEVKLDLKDPNGEKRVIQITCASSNGSGEGKVMLVNVDDEAGVRSSNEDDVDYQAAFGDLPPLGGPPKQEPEGFQ